MQNSVSACVRAWSRSRLVYAADSSSSSLFCALDLAWTDERASLERLVLILLLLLPCSDLLAAGNLWARFRLIRMDPSLFFYGAAKKRKIFKKGKRERAWWTSDAKVYFQGEYVDECINTVTRRRRASWLALQFF